MDSSLRSAFDHLGNYVVTASAGLWGIYLGYFPSEFGLFVKVGISTQPTKRMWGHHCNSPYPLERYSWAWVGTRQLAGLLERGTLARYEKFSTRGEWLLIDLDIETVDTELRAFIDRSSAPSGKAVLDWKQGTHAEVASYASLVVKERKKKKADAKAEGYGPRMRRRHASP